MAMSETQTLLHNIREFIFGYKATVGSPTSLSDVTKIARSEPITVVSSDLASVKDIYNILHGILNIYTAYYLQAVSLLSVDLQDARVLKILDRVNPDRDLKTFLAARSTYESFDVKVKDGDIRTLTLENAKYKLPGMSTKVSNIAIEDRYDDTEGGVTVKGEIVSGAIKKLDTFEQLGMSVGKVMEISFTVATSPDKAKTEIKIPVVVKLDTMLAPNDVISAIMTVNEDEISFGSRLKKALSGRISFIKDFILANDLIQNHKKTLMKDRSKIYNAILKRLNNSRFYSAISNNFSLAGASSIFVVTEQVEKDLIKKFGEGLTSTKVRNIIFENTVAMMIAVVDREWERVTIYIRGIEEYSQNSFGDFKTLAEKKDSSMMEIFKAISMGSAPVF